MLREEERKQDKMRKKLDFKEKNSVKVQINHSYQYSNGYYNSAVQKSDWQIPVKSQQRVPYNSNTRSLVFYADIVNFNPLSTCLTAMFCNMSPRTTLQTPCLSRRKYYQKRSFTVQINQSSNYRFTLKLYDEHICNIILFNGDQLPVKIYKW